MVHYSTNYYDIKAVELSAFSEIQSGALLRGPLSHDITNVIVVTDEVYKPGC